MAAEHYRKAVDSTADGAIKAPSTRYSLRVVSSPTTSNLTKCSRSFMPDGPRHFSKVATDKDNAAKNPTLPGRPDEQGFYRVGGEVTLPRRFGNATYRAEAQAAGINGIVTVEISLNEQSGHTSPRVRSAANTRRTR